MATPANAERIAVGQQVALERGEGAGRHSEEQGEKSRRADELQSTWQSKRDFLRYRVLVLQRSAEISLSRRAEVAQVLRRERAVKTEPLAQFLDRRGVRRHPSLRQQQLRRIARNKVDDQEDERGDDP